MGSPSVKDLLLARTLSQQQVTELLTPYGFKSVKSADNNLQALGDEPLARAVLADMVEPLLTLVSESADPDAALNHLERFAAACGNKLHLFSYLRERPRLLELVAKTFGASPFLAETLIRSPHYLYWVSDPHVLDHRRSKQEMRIDLSQLLRGVTTDHAKLDL